MYEYKENNREILIKELGIQTFIRKIPLSYTLYSQKSLDTFNFRCIYIFLISRKTPHELFFNFDHVKSILENSVMNAFLTLNNKLIKKKIFLISLYHKKLDMICMHFLNICKYKQRTYQIFFFPNSNYFQIIFFFLLIP